MKKQKSKNKTESRAKQNVLSAKTPREEMEKDLTLRKIQKKAKITDKGRNDCGEGSSADAIIDSAKVESSARTNLFCGANGGPKRRNATMITIDSEDEEDEPREESKVESKQRTSAGEGSAGPSGSSKSATGPSFPEQTPKNTDAAASNPNAPITSAVAAAAFAAVAAAATAADADQSRPRRTLFSPLPICVSCGGGLPSFLHGVACRSRSHRVCGQCVAKLAKRAAKGVGAPLECPGAGCNAGIDPRALLGSVGRRIRKKIEEGEARERERKKKEREGEKEEEGKEEDVRKERKNEKIKGKAGVKDRVKGTKGQAAGQKEPVEEKRDDGEKEGDAEKMDEEAAEQKEPEAGVKKDDDDAGEEMDDEEEEEQAEAQKEERRKSWRMGDGINRKCPKCQFTVALTQGSDAAFCRCGARFCFVCRKSLPCCFDASGVADPRHCRVCRGRRCHPETEPHAVVVLTRKSMLLKKLSGASGIPMPLPPPPPKAPVVSADKAVQKGKAVGRILKRKMKPRRLGGRVKKVGKDRKSAGKRAGFVKNARNIRNAGPSRYLLK